MKWTLRTARTLVAFAIVPLLGCSTDALVAPDSPAPVSLTLRMGSGAYGPDRHLVSCPVAGRRASGVATIGPEGGVLTMGDHALVIPAGALREQTRIAGEVLRGAALAVRFTPHGLQFAQPATLTMSYRGCPAAQRQAVRVAYVDGAMRTVLETPPSSDDKEWGVVRAAISHFSVYALAD